MTGPSQPSVTDEVWDDARVRSFLAIEPSAGINADFHVLLKAYRGMRPEDFERFLEFFLAQDRDIDARDQQGRTLWEIVGKHRQGVEFIEVKQRIVG